MSLLDELKKLLDNKNSKDENFESTSDNSEGENTDTDATVENTEEKFVEVKTTEDVILRVEGELAEGKAIEVIDETGSNPADNGEYTLEDGTVIVVEENEISSLTTPESEDDVESPEGEPEADQNMEEDDKKDEEDEEDMKTEKETFSKEDITESFNLLINEVKELKSSISEIETLKEELKGMNEDFEKFRKEPSTDSLKNEKTNREWGTLYSKFGKHRK